MVSFLYFWNEVIWTKYKSKRIYSPSAFLYHLPIFVIESIIIILLFYFTSYLPNIFYISSVVLISLLCFDLLHMIRECVVTDLHTSLKYDVRWRLNPPQLIQDYSWFSERFAHARYKKYNNLSCPICLADFDHEPSHYPLDKSLLHCGHLYHKSCLQNYEQYKWNNDNWPYPHCKCALCTRGYHIDTEKFEYDANYLNNLPWCYKEYDYPGKRWTYKHLWDPIWERYIAKSDQQWKEYPYKWNTEYFCEV